MSWRIRNIEIKNFKFFNKRFSLDTERKNILLYGENGSGKSSIYWSAFTHFQASFKNQQQAQKYFTNGNPENLRNRYAQVSDPSYIKISFDDGNGNSKTIEDSNNVYYSVNPEFQRFMRLTSMSSDFMNYKFLYSLFDFKNSQDNEIFSILENDAMPYFDLDDQLTDLNDNNRNTFNAEDWWRYINDTYHDPTAIPKNEGSQKRYKLSTDQYKKFQNLIGKFNRLLNSKLTLLVGRANSIINDTFKLKVNLIFEYEPCTFNNQIANYKYDGLLHAPKVKLRAEITSPNVVDRSPIDHPRSFFNEAKITCMALALRLAILESHPQSEDGASILFIDDLLISLDMPLRRKVIDILLNYADRFQLIIMTHDRAFFHLIYSEISILGKVDDWKKCELYINEANNCEEPILIGNADPLQKARQFLSQHEISASVNAARQAAEKVLKKLLPMNKILDLSYFGQCDLNGLIQKFVRLASDIGLPNPAPHLQDARQLLLNPFSHDDIETPFYKEELKLIIEELEKLKKIERTIIIDYPDVRNKTFVFKMDNDVVHHSFTGNFISLETFNKYTYEGNDYYNYPKVRLDTSNIASVQCKEWGLIRLYNKVANEIGHNTLTRPALIDCLFDLAGNKIIQ